MRTSTGDEVRRLSADGLRPAEIARRLGLAGPTVDHHLAAAASTFGARGQAADPPRDVSAALPTTRQEVERLLAAGLSRAAIAERLGLSRSTVSYHARNLAAPVDARCARRYDWAAVQAFYDSGRTMGECCERFGFNRSSWYDAVGRGAIRPRPAAMPLEELLREGVPRSRRHVKLRLLAEGLLENRCATCGISRWRGRPLSLALHHVNGERHDNRLENLELLCPNCHSQTENFSGRNGRRVRSD